MDKILSSAGRWNLTFVCLCVGICWTALELFSQYSPFCRQRRWTYSQQAVSYIMSCPAANIHLVTSWDDKPIFSTANTSWSTYLSQVSWYWQSNWPPTDFFSTPLFVRTGMQTSLYCVLHPPFPASFCTNLVLIWLYNAVSIIVSNNGDK